MTKTKQQAQRKEVEFVSLDETLDELLDMPGMRSAVEAGKRANAERDRVYLENLAAIRKAAGNLTQEDVAKSLGVKQAAVSRVESRGDILLSTLGDYLEAVGATEPRIVAVIGGMEVELDLHALAKKQHDRV
jgi:hypothetical protein